MEELLPLAPDAPPETSCLTLELGAYEALWMRERTSVASLARLFRRRPGSRPSDWVPQAEASRFA
ncbi:MAG: DNA-processing protein DprA, partial [Steroidobacteraceae bacterium]